MRIVMVFLLFGFMQSAIAITKCKLQGRTIYKIGSCPKNSVTSFLVKDEYVQQEQLEKSRRGKIKESKQAYKKLTTPKKRREVSEEWLEPESLRIDPAQMEVSNEGPHFKLQNGDQQPKKPHKINAPKMYDYTNDKLNEMERKLEEHNKALQQLQAE